MLGNPLAFVQKNENKSLNIIVLSRRENKTKQKNATIELEQKKKSIKLSNNYAIKDAGI